MMTEAARLLRTRHWMALVALIVSAWLVLIASSVPAELRASGRVFGTDILAALCVITQDAAGFARNTAMWMVMSVAMMVPPAIRAFAAYEELTDAGSARFWRLVAGFLAVWAGFAMLAAASQIALFDAGLVSPYGELRSQTLSALLLIGAGVYQFSPTKARCLAPYHQKATLMLSQRDGDAWQAGLRLGRASLGCCWALMSLAFVGGAMNVAVMALATLVLIGEKTPPLGQHVTRPVGWALIGSGLLLGVSAA
ncbi:MAG: DUF2182 domain-containing protein [Pseudomonadota bacterium]